MASADRMVSVQNPFYIQAANDTAWADSVHKLGIAYNQSFCIRSEKCCHDSKTAFPCIFKYELVISAYFVIYMLGLLFSFIGCILYDSVAIYF